jgi:diguanylate cyclase (GGDEF)-like protein
VARRKRARSAVIFADIDGLKRVNDELGHDTGDRLILDVALSAGLVKCDQLGDQTLADD